MRAFDPEVMDAVWTAVEGLIPVPSCTHPLGCHRPRASEKACFKMILVRLVTGCSWVDAEYLCDREVSDTTARARRDEWIAAGVFDRLIEEAIAGYDRIIGLVLGDVSVDGSLHKSPAGGEGTGPNPTDRGKLGHKWSMIVDAAGIPFGLALAGANRNDSILLAPTLDDAAKRGLLADVDTIWLDRGSDSQLTLERLAARGLTDAIIAKKRPRGAAKSPTPKQPMGLRWPVERTNSWLSNFGQLRRNTDRDPIRRQSQFQLAITFLLTAKLIDWRNRWSQP
jgi:transposase